MPAEGVKMTITYYSRDHYGTRHKYPIEHAEALARLTGCKTLRDSDVIALEAMGFKFREVVRPDDTE